MTNRAGEKLPLAAVTPIRVAMEIVKATDADLPALCELLGALFSQEAEFVPDPRLQAAGLRLILADEKVGQILVMRDNSQVLAMVSLLFHPSTALGARVAVLEDFVVRPDCRGRGLGSRLLDAAVELARAQGCRRVTLLTDHDNAAAQRLYARHGFAKSTMLTMRLIV